MNDGVSQNNRRCRWYSDRALQVFILTLKTFLGQTRVCVCRYRAAKCFHITTDVIYCSSLRRCGMLYVMPQNNVTTKQRNKILSTQLRHIAETRCWANDAGVSSVLWEVRISSHVTIYRRHSTEGKSSGIRDKPRERTEAHIKRTIHCQLNWAILLCDVIADGKTE
jgi:hypothetical protein